jgi:hypothetical protein
MANYPRKQKVRTVATDQGLGSHLRENRVLTRFILEERWYACADMRRIDCFAAAGRSSEIYYCMLLHES